VLEPLRGSTYDFACGQLAKTFSLVLYAHATIVDSLLQYNVHGGTHKSTDTSSIHCSRTE